MPVQFFGQFLLTNGVVTRTQLLEAIALQDKQNLKLGEHAVTRGYLTAADGARINQLQQLRDIKFGEAAVELELLTPGQVDELITAQRNSHLYLGDAVIQLGFGSPESVRRALDQFRREQQEYEKPQLDLSTFVLPERAVYEACVDLTSKMLLRVWDVMSKTGVPTTAVGAVNLQGCPYAVRLMFSGPFALRYVLAVPSEAAHHAAKKLLSDSSPDADTCNDLLRELANVVCGNAAALLARQGRSAEISPPETISGDMALGPSRALRVPLVTQHGPAVVALTY